MIYLGFSIENPWHNEKKRPWKDLFQKEYLVTKHKTLNVMLDFYTYELLDFNFNTKWRGEDHAGPRFSIRVLGLGFCIAVNDTRHWNYDKNRWVNYDDPAEVNKYW